MRDPRDVNMKKNCLILFGGQSSEHDVSCMSVLNVIDNLDTELYDPVYAGITKEGHWVYVDSREAIADGSWILSDVSAVLSPDATEQCLYLMDQSGVGKIHIDVAFPVLHGLYGEDGTVQGIFELARIPYVGCGVLASAVSMDKVHTKLIADALGIRQADYVFISRNELEADEEKAMEKVETRLSYPLFIKPSCAGSSVGVHRVENRAELKDALWDASCHDSKILAEELISGREIECAVLGTDKNAVASGVGEILAAAEFYDFDAKYNNSDSQTITDPDLPVDIVDKIREDALLIFRGVGGYSLSRVDFFVDSKGIVFNEINTMPGFTAISMYPMLFEKAGLSKKELVSRLLETAFSRREH